MNIKKGYYRDIIEYNSLAEFYEYIMETPINETFKGYELSSKKGGYDFTYTHSFDEAVSLFKNGWKDMSEKLTQILKVEMGNMEKIMVSKNVASVQGYQPIVPLYLNGIPANMVSRQMQPMKQKIITINKSVTYSGRTTIEQIVEQSIKALSIVKKIENQNYRCNLNIVLGTEVAYKAYVIRIRIKSANERLNVNKVSFPLVHPSMLRRLFFRFIEVYPTVPYDFRLGYGKPTDPKALREIYSKEILLPQFIHKDIKQIKTLNDLENIY